MRMKRTAAAVSVAEMDEGVKSGQLLVGKTVTEETAAGEVYVADGWGVVMTVGCRLLLVVLVAVWIAVEVWTVILMLQVLKMLCVIEEVMLLIVLFADRLSTATGGV